jgi:hypothetical protein
MHRSIGPWRPPGYSSVKILASAQVNSPLRRNPASVSSAEVTYGGGADRRTLAASPCVRRSRGIGAAIAPTRFVFLVYQTGWLERWLRFGVDFHHRSIGASLAEGVSLVANVYQLLLNRIADPTSTAWINALDNGASQASVVLAMESGTEYIQNQVIALYSHYLNRVVDDQGLQYWIGFLQAGGSFEQVAEELTGSQEYFVLKGGTNQGFVTGLYHDVLNRNASDAEIAGWVAVLNGGESRLAVSVAFLTSQEYRTSLVQADYMTLLKRPADDAGLVVWVNALNAGATDQQVLAQIFGSPEGYQLWS